MQEISFPRVIILGLLLGAVWGYIVSAHLLWGLAAIFAGSIIIGFCVSTFEIFIIPILKPYWTRLIQKIKMKMKGTP